MSISNLRERNEIEEKYTWNANAIFADDAAWEVAISSVEETLPTLAAYQGRLSEGAATLAEFVAVLEPTQRQAYHAYIYAMMARTVNMGDQAGGEKFDRVRGLVGRLGATTAFVEPELLQIGLPTLREWISGEARLSHWGHYLDKLAREEPHVRSAEVEEVLGMAHDGMVTATTTHSILADAELAFADAVGSDGEKSAVTSGSLRAIMFSHDRELRRTAWESYADGFLNVKSTVANVLATGVKQNVFKARVRRYDSALQAAVSANHIPETVFHTLIDTFKAQLPTWHKYYAIRTRALGLDKMTPYDVWAPLSANPPVISYEESVDLIADGLQPLGADYVAMMRRGSLEERWIDVYSSKGKRTGAFSAGVQGTPPYIMLNHTDNLSGLSTLAHELGHSMHSYYSWETQPQIYSGYTIFEAEVASNFNQALVRHKLLQDHSEPDYQVAVIEEAMANFYRYFFLMPTLARFELAIHERVERGGALSADYMINLLTDYFAEAYGDAVELDHDRVGITWAQFHTHLYSNFYVYQYATGISGAHALAQKIIDGEAGAVDAYRGFLSRGGSMFPLDNLRLAGVDLETAEAVETTFGVLQGYVERLDKLFPSQ